MSEKKVLIVTYYWPPSGGSGVQRWLKFVKYLPQFGWKPYVFTPANPSFAIQDESLLSDVPKEAEVIRFPIWEPYDAFFRIAGMFGKKKEAKPTELVSARNKSFFQRTSTWIRANFFIPDPRVFWVKPSVKYLQHYLKENQIDIVVTTGPPHSIHLIGYGLKKNNPAVCWIADFRDPWTGWDLLESFPRGKRALAAHQKLEQQVLTTADAVISVTPTFVKRFEATGKREVQLITNGYDGDDFAEIKYQRPSKFVIRHVGIVNEKCDPRPFMRALGQLATANKDFADHVSLEFNGEVHPDFKKFVVDDPLLKSVTHFTGNVSHDKLMQRYGESALLLLVMTGYNDLGIIPGKVFEYIATGIPILSVGNIQGDASQFLKQTALGEVADSDESEKIQNFLTKRFEEWRRSERAIRTEAAQVKYSRKSLTGELTKLMESLTR